MTKEEYEKNKRSMKPWRCDNGHTYMAFKNSCVFCEHCHVFWDYTSGPYLFLCDTICNCPEFVRIGPSFFDNCCDLYDYHGEKSSGI